MQQVNCHGNLGMTRKIVKQALTAGGCHRGENSPVYMTRFRVWTDGTASATDSL